MLRGRGDRVAAGRRVAVGPGDLYIVAPGERHGARADPGDPYHYFSICFDPAAFGVRSPARAARDEMVPAVEEANAIGAELRVHGQRVIHGGEGAEHLFRRILAELDRHELERRTRTLTAVMVRALVVELLVFVTRCAIAERGGRGTRLAAARRAEFNALIDWLPTRLADPPSLAEMAKRAGLSPAHFAVAFKRETGRTPHEHLTELRVDEAARRIAERPRASFALIARELGFSSAQYLSLVFRRTRGCTPREWRDLAARAP